MFTGIIEETGELSGIRPSGNGSVIKVSANRVLEGISVGDSISVSGVCLTAVQYSDKDFTVDVSRESLERSSLGNAKTGLRVNLERAATPSSRLGGHIVQGHVDTVGTFRGAKNEGDFWTVTIGFPEEFARYLVFKGSVAVEGISLTVAELREDEFDIAVIPKTWEVTNLSSLRDGDSVNLEADVIAKYVERMLFHSKTSVKPEGVTLEKLKSLGIA